MGVQANMSVTGHFTCTFLKILIMGQQLAMFSYEEWTNARIPSKILVMWLNESFVVLLLSLLRLVDTVLLTYQ